jgi:hypothetical protein
LGAKKDGENTFLFPSMFLYPLGYAWPACLAVTSGLYPGMVPVLGAVPAPSVRRGRVCCAYGYAVLCV